MGRFINADAFAATGQGLLGNNMFSYCINNPVNLIDPTGCVPVWFYDDPIDQAVADFFYWYRESDADETDNKGKLTLNALAKRTVQAIEHNIVLSVGIGLGLYGGIISSDLFNVDMGIHYDLLNISYTKGKISVQEYARQGVEATFFFYSLGDSDAMYRPYDGSWPGDWKQDDTGVYWGLFGASAYFFGGGSVVVGFDLNSFLMDISNIYK